MEGSLSGHLLSVNHAAEIYFCGFDWQVLIPLPVVARMEVKWPCTVS